MDEEYIKIKISKDDNKYIRYIKGMLVTYDMELMSQDEFLEMTYRELIKWCCQKAGRKLV